MKRTSKVNISEHFEAKNDLLQRRKVHIHPVTKITDHWAKTLPNVLKLVS